MPFDRCVRRSDGELHQSLEAGRRRVCGRDLQRRRLYLRAEWKRRQRRDGRKRRQRRDGRKRWQRRSRHERRLRLRGERSTASRRDLGRAGTAPRDAAPTNACADGRSAQLNTQAQRTLR